MKKVILASSLVGLALVASPAAAETVSAASGPTLLSEASMDSIVAGETFELAQFLRTSDVIGYFPNTTIPVYRQIDMSGLPDEAAQKMFAGEGPITNGTNSLQGLPIRPGVPIYSNISTVGIPSDGQGVRFVTIYADRP